MITIRDIARQAGVSKSTVALALRDSPLCAEKTRLKVKRVAADLGYRRDPALVARMAYVGARGRSGSPGPSLAYLTDYDRRTVLSTERPGQNGFIAARTRAEELGCTLDLLCYGGPDLSLTRLHHILDSRGILGLVIAPHSTPLIELELNWHEFAIVCVGFSIRSPRFDRVGFDHFEALLDVCERASQRGYQRIALFVSDDNDARVMHLARAAFLRWQSDQVSVWHAPVFVMNASEPGAPYTWYERHRPDCIILYGKVKWLIEAGIPVGQKVAVITPIRNDLQPEYGGYSIQLGHLAVASVDMVLAKLFRNERGVPTQRQTLLIQAPWIDGPAAFTPAAKVAR
jgi:DNA-binding LacI/PurR family transcriptional regulator